jgi:hypothetical protein
MARKIKGPARSVSSIKFLSTVLKGFKTVTPFVLIWEKLIPSSVKVEG